MITFVFERIPVQTLYFPKFVFFRFNKMTQNLAADLNCYTFTQSPFVVFGLKN